MIFESLDADTYDRSVQPVTIVQAGVKDGFRNVLNSYMDHVWDGFYTGQTRLSRFPSMIETGNDYNVLFTGTPPGKMRFKLKDGPADKGGLTGKGIFLRVRYAEAGSY